MAWSDYTAPSPTSRIRAPNKDDHPFLAKREIWPSQKRSVPPPARDARRAQQVRQGKLSLFVAAPANS